MVRILRFPRKKSSARCEVKGPIRCHKCQALCRDAVEYLGHKCEPKKVKPVSASTFLAGMRTTLFSPSSMASRSSRITTSTRVSALLSSTSSTAQWMQRRAGRNGR